MKTRLANAATLIDMNYRPTFGRVLAPILCMALGTTALAQAPSNAGCGVSATWHGVLADASQFGHGLRQVPRNASQPRNLKWEFPIAATTGVLIAEVDQPAANRIHSKSFEQMVGRWSNIGLGMEFGTAGLAWAIGCREHKYFLRETGLTALTAMGAATGSVLVLKLSFNRQFPYTANSKGEFWEGGRSFPSGHAAASFAFASVIAHRYPHQRWMKWGAYALATGVSLSRYPAKKHYPSDILVGATIGYVTGTYLVGH